MSEQQLIADMPEYYSISIEPQTGIVFSEAKGFWNMEIAAQYMVELMKAADMSRAQNGKARMLFDFSLSQVQAPEMFSHNNHFLRTGEKVAVVVASALLKRQLGRQDPQADYGYFENRAAALDWLTSSS